MTELDSDLALYWVSTMEEVIYRSTTGTRFLAVLLGMFGWAHGSARTRERAHLST